MWNPNDNIRYDLNDRSAVRRLEKILKPPKHETTFQKPANQATKVATLYAYAIALWEAFKNAVVMADKYHRRQPEGTIVERNSDGQPGNVVPL